MVHGELLVITVSGFSFLLFIDRELAPSQLCQEVCSTLRGEKESGRKLEGVLNDYTTSARHWVYRHSHAELSVWKPGSTPSYSLRNLMFHFVFPDSNSVLHLNLVLWSRYLMKSNNWTYAAIYSGIIVTRESIIITLWNCFCSATLFGSFSRQTSLFPFLSNISIAVWNSKELKL